MNNLKSKQHGSVILFLIVVMAIGGFLINDYIQRLEHKRMIARIETVHTQTSLYMNALENRRKAFCNANGVIDYADLNPVFITQPWDSIFGGVAEFEIENSPASVVFRVTVTFPNADIAELVASRNVENIDVNHNPGEVSIEFTRVQSLRASQFRNNYNRANILSSFPSAC